MATNRHERFRGEAALECGGPTEEGFAVENLTPRLGTKLTRFARHFACLGNHYFLAFQT